LGCADGIGRVAQGRSPGPKRLDLVTRMFRISSNRLYAFCLFAMSHELEIPKGSTKNTGTKFGPSTGQDMTIHHDDDDDDPDALLSPQI
jgi:hypothetical protein